MQREVEPRARHWADEVAQTVAGRPGTAVVSSGISPSGQIHVGNMREVLTADAVYRALRDLGKDARFHFVADSFDPLRKVYPFLDPARYESMVGRPLSDIPCPCGDHESYAEHFLEPFLAALGRLGVEVEIVRADRLYRSGRMTDRIVEALRGRDACAAILRDLTGKDVGSEWSPFTALCPACGTMHRTRVLGHCTADRTIDYACACGSAGTVPMAGGGKLTWRVDWPARWKELGVTVEPFGKDHATRGGSYDTGVRIVREVFGGEPPFPVPYEWISLKGQGDMSSSKGNVVSTAEMVEVVPPDVLRYVVLRERPSRAIAFDPGLPLLQVADEVDAASATGRDPRALELSRAGAFAPVGVPLRHLVVVAQAARFDPGRVVEILRRTGYPDASREAIAERLEYARRWLARFAPEDIRFEVSETLPEAVERLSTEQRAFLGRLASALDGGLDDAGVHERIYAVAGEFPEVPPKSLFEAVYLALLGKPRGPRAGSFIRILGIEACARRFRDAAGGS